MTSLYEFIRQELAARGGECSRAELLAAIQSHKIAAERLSRGQGFPRLLQNMRYSGFIEVRGDVVRRTNRRVGHRRAYRPAVHKVDLASGV